MMEKVVLDHSCKYFIYLMTSYSLLDKGTIRECIGVEAASEVLEEIFHRGSKKIYEAYLAPKVKPYSALYCNAILKSCVDQTVITRDFGVLT
jgi:hypothetical protein